MQSIAVSDKVWFEEDLLGATLNFYSDCRPGGVLFRVGISFKSLQECNQALCARACSWTIKDGTLSFYGDQEEISLSFMSLGKDQPKSAIVLRGSALKTFRYVVNSLAFRQIVASN